MTLDQEIRRAEASIHWLDNAIHDLEFKGGRRSAFAAASFDAVGELNKGVCVLLSRNLNAPAFALTRTIFETYIRGVWLLHCAEESDLDRFQNDKVKRTFTEIIAAVEAHPAYEDQVLSRAKAAGFDAMSSYAHGGFQQISRRLGTDSIEPQFTEDEQIEVIRFATSFAFMSALGIANLAENEPLALDLLEQIRSYAANKA